MALRLKRLQTTGLKPLKPLPLLNTSREFAKNTLRKDEIIRKLKHMNRDNVIELFEEFDAKPNIGDIRFNIEDLGTYDGRKLVEVDGQKFYKSTGTSREGTHLKGIFLPYDKINRDAPFPQDRRIQKLEDKYILAPLQELLPIEEELIKYGRFINEENAIKSWYLSKLYGLDGGSKKRKSRKQRKS